MVQAHPILNINFQLFQELGTVAIVLLGREYSCTNVTERYTIKGFLIFFTLSLFR